MESQKLQGQVELIREVFEYILRFQGKTFVIKIDCSVMDGPFFPLLLKDLVLLHRQGIRIVLVPGATQRIDEILTRYGIQWQTVEGVRVSTAEAMPFIKMAAFDVSNRLMTQLAANDADGVIGNWVKARSLGVRKGIDFQHTGTVERIEADIVRKVLAEGLVPILPNIGWNAAGTPYNVSSNELACVVGRTLAAEKLFFISDHRGVIGGQYALPPGIPLSEEGLVTHLSVAEAQKLLDLNPAGDPMLGLVRLACQACREGVSRVHIVNGEIEGVVLKEIFSSVGCGTMVYANQHENVRDMRPADIPEVLRIMRPFIEKEVLVERRAEDLAARLAEYVVYEVDGLIHACGALHRSSEDPRRAEVAAVAVDETYAGFGIGRRIVSYLLERGLAWSEAVNAAVADMVHGVPPAAWACASCTCSPPRRPTGSCSSASGRAEWRTCRRTAGASTTASATPACCCWTWRRRARFHHSVACSRKKADHLKTSWAIGSGNVQCITQLTPETGR